MKKSLLSASFVLLGLSALTPAMAQVIVSASGPNEQQATVFNDYGFPNSYTIDYSPFCASTACAGTKKQLTAMVADDGTSAKLYVDDQTNAPGTPWATLTLPSGGGSAPDVVVGNDFINTGQYIVGVTAVTGGTVMLYLYRIKNVGLGGSSLTITPIPPVAGINVSGSTGNAVPPAHIDLACSSANPYMGLPNANVLVITWQDVATGIMAYSNQLNTPGAGVVAVINSNLNLSNPDVAYVERTAAANKVAEFSYFDLTSSPNTLYYSEWQTIPSIAPGAATIYDNTKNYFNPFPGMVSVGRIDGIDDYTKNTPGGGNAIFCIAAAAPSPGVSIFEYNDITGPGVATNITSPVTAPAGGVKNNTNQIPVVACGPGKYYSVGYYSDPPSSSGGAQKMYYATAINWNNGLTLAPGNAYEIMSGSYDPSYLPGLCLSATCNTNILGVQDLFAGFDNYAFLWYKYSMPVPYAFKNAPATTTPAVVAATGEWQLYPNPANSNVTLIAPESFNTTTGASYDITDMTGKIVKSNDINASKHQINVSSLPAGSYLINVHTDAKNTKTIKFEKE